MKAGFTYDEVHYISETSKAPTSIDFDNPQDKQTEDLTTGYLLLGVGVQKITEAPNAETEETAYINQRTKTTIVKSYNNKWSGTADKIVDDKAVMVLYNIAQYQKTGAEAELNLVIIDISQPYGEGGKTYKARLVRVSCSITNINKEAANKINFDFDLNGVKDVVHGTFAEDTKTFTVTDTSQPPAGAGGLGI